MEELHAYELHLIEWIQQIRSPALDSFFRFMNFFDRQEFAFILIPLIWIGFNWKSGLRLISIVLLSALVNYSLKELFQQPRPYYMEPHLGLLPISGFGLPSGAAQTAVILSGILIYTQRTIWAWILGLVFFSLLSFSRIYLGVHFPTDVFGGWFTGALLLYTYIKIFPKIESKLTDKAITVALITTFLILLGLILFAPIHIVLKLSAVAFGVCVGLFLSNRYDLFLADPKHLGIGIFRGMYGVLGTFLVYLGVGFLPIESMLVLLIMQFFAMGLWLSFGANALYRLCGG